MQCLHYWFRFYQYLVSNKRKGMIGTMNGLEKLTQKIIADARAEADDITMAAEAQAKQIIEKGAEDAQKAKTVVIENARIQAVLLKSSAESSAHSEGRRLQLSTKISAINRVFEDALIFLQNQDPLQYFDLMKQLIEKYATGNPCVLEFSPADMERMPADFSAFLSSAYGTITLRTAGRDLGGGFIIKCGGVEENCTFASMLSAGREQLEDEIAKVLFGA